MFSEKTCQLGVRLGCLALAFVACSLGACGEQVVVGTQPADTPSALPSTDDADGDDTPPRALAADGEPDSDGDDDGQDDDEDDDGQDDDGDEGDEPSDPDDDGDDGQDDDDSADDELDGNAAD